MQPIGSLAAAELKVLEDIRRVILTTRRLSELPFDDITSGIEVLQKVRAEIYEDINQIQHERLVLSALRSITRSDDPEGNVTWFWNPRQSGSGDEPDLRGIVGSNIVVSAEITTSEKPIGTIDSRMQKVLEKLSLMEGKRYYCVRTDAMYNRALTKIAKNKYDIEVLKVN